MGERGFSVGFAKWDRGFFYISRIMSPDLWMVVLWSFLGVVYSMEL